MVELGKIGILEVRFSSNTKGTEVSELFIYYVM